MGRKIGTVLSFAAIVVEIFSGLFLTPLLIRSLGQAEYGVYSLVLSVTAYLALLDMGVGNSVVRFMSKYRVNGDKTEQRKFLGITTVYYGVMLLLIVIIGIVLIQIFPMAFAKGLSDAEVVLAQKLLAMTVINIAITIGTAGYFYTIIAFEKFIISKGVVILCSVFRITLQYILLLHGAKSIEIVFVNLCFTVIARATMVLYVLCKLKIRPTLKKVNFSQIKEIVFYSVFIMLQMVATQVNNLADQILIGALVQSSTVILAVYAVGAHINQYAQNIGGALNGVLMPGVVAMVEKKATPKELENEMVRIGRLNFAFIAFVWCAFLVFGQQFVALWAGEVNRDAYYVALILMFPQVIILTESIGTQILWAIDKHKVQAVLKIVIVILNLVLTVLLIKWNPLLGATLGTFISLMLGDVIVMQIVFKKDIGISLLGYYKGLLKGIVPALALALVAGFLFRRVGLSGWFGFIINCGVMTVFYGICMLLFGFNKQEKHIIMGAVKKLDILKKIKSR